VTIAPALPFFATCRTLPRLSSRRPPVHFEITHEFDIPLDALELAVISPSLVDKLGPKLVTAKLGIESLKQNAHALKDGVLDRVWHYQANVKIPAFARGVITREMCAWDEHSVYDLRRHESEWTIQPNIKREWHKYFVAKGTYAIVPMGEGRAKRVVKGDLEVRVPVVRQVAERMIVNEVKKTFEAEAATLRDMATLV
jgi:hypothetical protein